ncbi:hypothetical protein DFH28DRAFT_1033234 [Melampsora americana]|nr:hypothetical protein DFH28DRAFT_1033234 [Melampsora americana]
MTIPNPIHNSPSNHSTSTLISPRLSSISISTNTSNQTIKLSSSSSSSQPQSQSQSQAFCDSTPHSTASSSSSSTCSSPPYPKQLALNHFPLKPPSTNSLQYRSGRIPYTPLLTSLILLITFYLGYIIGSASLFSPNQELSIIDLKSRLNLISSNSKFNFPINPTHSKSKIPFLIHLPNPKPSSSSSSSSSLIHSKPTHSYSSNQIPRYLHYVFGMSSDFGEKPFGFIHYAALQSALQILKPEKIFIHYAYRPTGWWFDRVTEIDQVILIKVRDVKEIYGRPVEHFAHKADIIRLEALRDYGGIYLDFDVFIVRDFTSLLNEEVVLGQEQSPSSSTEILGICNAIILSRPFSPFISRWLSSYKSFDKTRWADHSALIPWLLAQKFPNEVTILGPKAFFYPLWHENDLWKVHRSLDWDFDKSGQLAYHAWSSLSYKTELSKLNPERIHRTGGVEQGESSFSWFVRRYIHDEIRKKWNEDLKNGELKE